MINTYYDDWMKTTLDSEVVDCVKCEEGYWVACKESVFYVEGGGMASDRGTLNGLEVKSLKWENDLIYHLVEEALSGVVHMQLDEANRIMKTQIHTAQHLMCGIMNKRFNAPTISFFNDEVEAGAEMGFEYFDHEIMEQLETICNDYIREDLSVQIIYPTPEEAAKHVALEKLDHEELRAVLIGDIDYNMCACVHVPSLRHIQMIKFQRFEKTTRGYRIYFLCGAQLLKTSGKQLEVLSKSSKQLAVPLLEVYDGIKRLHQEIKSLKQAEADWKNRYVSMLVEEVAKAEDTILVKEFDSIDIKTFTTLCSMVVRNHVKGILFVCHQDDRAHVVIAHHKELQFASNTLFQEVAKRFGLRGGGNASMAQGGGTYHEDILSCLKELASTLAA